MACLAVIEVRDLYKSYGKTVALRGASFSVPSKTVAALLGPNGSGKTTTLKILVGVLKRDRGDVKVFGFDPWINGVEVRERLGILHEKPIFPGDVKVKVLLKYLAKLKGYSGSEVERVARITGLVKYLDSRVKGLSRGYLQRLGLAQALIGDPELLLLDEPTANLDPLARREILRLIKSFQKELGVTILVSSHIIPELEEICEYAVFIKEGIIVDYGRLEDLSKKYFTEVSYRVVVEKPRELASKAISFDFVKGVEVEENSVEIKVKAGRVSELADFLESSKDTYGVRKVEFVRAELGDLYERAVAGT
ncbi:MAG: ABC transporter ATP-binding protein [Thermoprotei archaeon]|nr:MAG: ABC transporter ATP-binding protein [Thermoprotei archaeon]